MKKNRFKNFMYKLNEILTNNISIIILVTLLASIVFLMYQKGFKINVDMTVNPQQSAVLVEDRVPSLAVYYQRQRVPVTIVLDTEENKTFEFEVKYNANRLFEPYFENKIPEKEGYLFTHFSLEEDGEPLDPGLRVTEPLTVYANWTEKISTLPYQVIARINYQIEIGRRRYASYFYDYKKINKGANTTVELDDVDGLRRLEGLEVKLRVDGTEKREIVDYNFGFNREDTRTLSYDLNGGELLVSTQQRVSTVPVNSAVSEPPGVKKENKRFIGWSLTEDGPIIPLEDVLVSDDTTLYAQFQDIIVQPSANSTQGRYLTTYFVEGVGINSTFVAISVTDNIGEINEIIEAELLEFDHLESIIYGDLQSRSFIFNGQFLIVSKKDKMSLLNDKILAYTNVNPFGVVLLVVMFVTMFWSFFDSKSNAWKILVWALLMAGIAVMIFVLPKTINFSNYFQNIWNLSKEINPKGTSVEILTGLVISGTIAAIGAGITFITFGINLTMSKLKEKEELLEETKQES